MRSIDVYSFVKRIEYSANCLAKSPAVFETGKEYAFPRADIQAWVRRRRPTGRHKCLAGQDTR